MSRTIQRRSATARKRVKLRDKERIILQEQQCRRRLLQDLGLWNDVKSMHQLESLSRLRRARFALRLAQETPTNGITQEILRRLRERLNAPTWQPPELRNPVSPQQYESLLLPIIVALSRCQAPRRCSQLQRFASQARRQTSNLASDEAYSGFLSHVVTEFRDILVDYSRMNNRIYFLTMGKSRNESGQQQFVFELHYSDAERERLLVDGECRWVYRCGQPALPGSVHWVEWNMAELRLTGAMRRLPVFIQQHTLDRIYGHEGRLRTIQNEEAFLHDLVWQCLRDPVIHHDPTRPNIYLVEYGFEECKLGYLVAELLPEAILVRTFLFLTMDGTPEGNALRQRLRMSRSDKTYLQLDQIETLVGTDVRNDRTLRGILEECHCGHLFSELDVHGRLGQGRAAEIRRYLRLSDGTQTVAQNTLSLGAFK